MFDGDSAETSKDVGVHRSCNKGLRASLMDEVVIGCACIFTLAGTRSNTGKQHRRTVWQATSDL